MFIPFIPKPAKEEKGLSREEKHSIYVDKKIDTLHERQQKLEDNIYTSYGTILNDYNELKDKVEQLSKTVGMLENLVMELDYKLKEKAK